MERKDYTIQVYRIDRRRKDGQTLAFTRDIENSTIQEMESFVEALMKDYDPKKHLVECHETWVERTNVMSGAKFMERFDTPYCASPRSETYFSM